MTARSYVPMEAARRHLDEARRCLERNQKGVAAPEAYYAMYHVVAHAAESRGDAGPKTHEGMEWYFFHELVQAGPLTLDDHKTHFDDARAARLRWHYQISGGRCIHVRQCRGRAASILRLIRSGIEPICVLQDQGAAAQHPVPEGLERFLLPIRGRANGVRTDGKDLNKLAAVSPQPFAIARRRRYQTV